MEDGGDAQANAGQQQQRAEGAGSNHVERLLRVVLQTAEEEAHAQHKQQVGENGAEKRSLIQNISKKSMSGVALFW